MKIFLVLFVFCFCFAQANAYNALQDHQKYRYQLKNDSSKQISDNPKYLYYYKGKSAYGGFSQYSSQKNYVKKGVRFKIESAKSSKNTNNRQNNQNQKTDTVISSTVDSNHNVDAE